MITDNEIYSDLVNVSKKTEFLANPKNSNKEKAEFWTIIHNRLNTNIIDYIKRDKRLYGW